MLPQSQPKKPKNSSRVNLVISAIFHAILVGVLIYFAAREGLIGKKMQKIAVEMVKEKKPEAPKPKPEPPKVQPPKETPKPVETPKVVETPKAAPPPSAAPPVVAPPAVEVPSFQFAGGAAVETSSDPVQLYKGYLEYVLRSKWDRPDNMDDDKYVAEVRVNVDRKGQLTETKWLQGSGNPKWDDSVKRVFQIVKNVDRPPPTNFPPQVTIRFDVQEETESVLQ